MFRTEFEIKLNHACLHVYTDRPYEEDYQMPMLSGNMLFGILPVEGCEIEGKGCYTYEISGLSAMKSKYEKTRLGKEDIAGFVKQLLKVTEELQQYMLDPDCLVLNPEYIFYKQEQCYFCYLPGKGRGLKESFHELTEYFVKTLDYEDTEGIFLAYELHKATLQEHYDLRQIMKDYDKRCIEREEERCEEESNEYEEDNNDEWEGISGSKRNYLSELSGGDEADQQKQKYAIWADSQEEQQADMLREESGFFAPWRNAVKRFRKKRWGNWDDLFTEKDIL